MASEEKEVPSGGLQEGDDGSPETPTEATSLLGGDDLGEGKTDPLSSAERAEKGTDKSRGILEAEKDAKEKKYSLQPRRNCCHMIFVFIGTITAVSAACMALSQVLSLVVAKVTWMQGLLRFYICIFDLCFILTELEVDFFLQRFRTFDNWIFRGFIYSFVGLIGVEESYSVQMRGKFVHSGFKPSFSGKVASIFIKVSSLCVFLLGMLYLLMGICFLRRLKDKFRANFEEQFKMSKLSKPDVK